MSFHTDSSRCALVFVCALVALFAIVPEGAVGATSTVHEKPPLGISVPASARVGGTTGPTTTATTASGAQPGTVAPGATPSATTPTTSAPTTTGAPPVATTPTTTAPATTSPSTTTPSPGAPTVVGVARKTTSPSTHLSTGALALAILGALLALGCAIWAMGRWLALEPRWTISTMHSLREATYRASATWAEFSDWARMGR